jgi:hypothetical protein
MEENRKSIDHFEPTTTRANFNKSWNVKCESTGRQVD